MLRPPYSGRGLVLSWLLFDTNQVEGDVPGDMAWIRTNTPTARYYPRGFTNLVGALGSVYRVPVGTTNRVLAIGNGIVFFSGANLSGPFTNDVFLATNNKVINLSSNRLTLTVVKSSGLFNGGVVVPETGKSSSFKGALFQRTNMNYGSGYFLGTNQSGRVWLGRE